jgi:hypothetical protein
LIWITKISRLRSKLRQIGSLWNSPACTVQLKLVRLYVYHLVWSVGPYVQDCHARLPVAFGTDCRMSRRRRDYQDSCRFSYEVQQEFMYELKKIFFLHPKCTYNLEAFKIESISVLTS